MSDRRGVAVILSLVAIALVESLIVVMLTAVVIRTRLAGDARWATEGSLVADAALATARVSARAILDTLGDGATAILAAADRGDGWIWSAEATRRGEVIRLTARAERRDASGALVAERRASLLLVRQGADTVRVLVDRPRF